MGTGQDFENIVMPCIVMVYCNWYIVDCVLCSILCHDIMHAMPCFASCLLMSSVFFVQHNLKIVA